ncbi:hypothetical protein NKJ12_08555 [Mesorhizobium sp. M0195]
MARRRATAAVVLAAFSSLGFLVPSRAHDAPSGWSYPLACCHGDAEHGECQRIPARAVHVRPSGWVVILRPGDHRKITRQQRYFIPYGDEIPSQDGNYHICLHPTEEHENCFLAPPDAM